MLRYDLTSDGESILYVIMAIWRRYLCLRGRERFHIDWRVCLEVNVIHFRQRTIPRVHFWPTRATQCGQKRCNKCVTHHFWRIFFLICVNSKQISLSSSPINTLLSMLLKELRRYLFSFWNYGWKCDLILPQISVIFFMDYGVERNSLVLCLNINSFT